MSRSEYSDNFDDRWGLWRGAVMSAIRGQRGQAFLRELLVALDAMPDKRIIRHSFSEAGAYCTLGVIGAQRGVAMPHITDPDDYSEGEIRRKASRLLHIAPAMAAEIMFKNDEDGEWNETEEDRWLRMRSWVYVNIV